jgi:peptidoglycan hydrolase-like protein with peptidoglycan-binding domain
MTRSLTAAIALAATLGIAGLAQAQTTPAPVSPSAPGTVPATQGPGTAQTMEPAQTAEPAQTTEPAPASVSPATVQKAQEQLKSQGLYRGPADGRIGPATRTAVSRYQRKEGLPQTAMLDPPTLKHLLPGSFSDDSSTTPSR